MTDFQDDLGRLIVVSCAIWYHLYNLKNVKNAHGGKLLLVKLHAEASHSITYYLLPNQILRESLHKFNCECQDQDMGNYNYLQLPA